MADVFDIRDLTFALEPALGLPELEEIWTDLVSRSNCSFFLTWDWIGTWLATTGAKPLLFSARDGDKIVALALFVPTRNRRHGFVRTNSLMLHQIGDPHFDMITIEHNGILADRGYSARILEACLTFLKQARLPKTGFKRWDEIHLGGITADTLGDQRAGLKLLEQNRKASWIVDLESLRQSGKAYLDTLSSNSRYQVRRAMRLYEASGPLSVTRAASVSQAFEYFEELKELHQRYWQSRGQPGGFANEFFVRFHRSLIQRGVEKGTVDLLRVVAGGQIIGQVYNFVHQGVVYAYQTGFNYDEDAKLKPGLVSHVLCIERDLREGARVYDFMAGDHRYKSSLGIPGPDMLSVVLQRRSPVILIEEILRRSRRTLSGSKARAAGVGH